MAAFWFLLIGALLLLIAVLGRFLERLPMSPAMIYLLVGFLLGPTVFNALELHPMRELALLETFTEFGVLIALFTVGVKIRVPLGDGRWRLPVRLATVSMMLTILGVSAAGYWLLGFPPAIALLIGAVLAPTDPVLASDVQLRSPEDRDSLRFALTGEGGLNDGTAFPFVYLGLGLLGVRELGEFGWRWLLLDLAWGTIGGLVIGFLIGTAVARAVRALRAWRSDAAILDGFLLLGVIGLSYGAALAAQTLGFLAVFAAGLALRRADDIRADEMRDDLRAEARGSSTRATDHGPLTPGMLSVNELLERFVETGIVLLVGAMISTGYWSAAGLALAGLLILLIRPLAVWLSVRGALAGDVPRRLLCWFGIRGIGSAYYAAYVAGHDMDHGMAMELLSCVFTVIAVSIVIHGVSATPLMDVYQRRRAPLGAPPPVSDKR